MSTVVADPMTRTFLDIPAAAETAGISERQFRRLIYEGEIKVMRIRRKQFVLTSVLKGWMETRNQKR